MKRDKPPLVVVRKTAKGLSPVSAWDSEILMSDSVGTEYDLVKRAKRSLPQQRLYWGLLRNVVRATGAWPHEQALHDELKLICGYHRPFVNWETGATTTILDSTAFNAMNADEFKQYFDLSVEKLNAHLGWDVLAFMETA